MGDVQLTSKYSVDKFIGYMHRVRKKGLINKIAWFHLATRSAWITNTTIKVTHPTSRNAVDKDHSDNGGTKEAVVAGIKLAQMQL